MYNASSCGCLHFKDRRVEGKQPVCYIGLYCSLYIRYLIFTCRHQAWYTRDAMHAHCQCSIPPRFFSLRSRASLSHKRRRRMRRMRMVLGWGRTTYCMKGGRAFGAKGSTSHSFVKARRWPITDDDRSKAKSQQEKEKRSVHIKRGSSRRTCQIRGFRCPV